MTSRFVEQHRSLIYEIYDMIVYVSVHRHQSCINLSCYNQSYIILTTHTNGKLSKCHFSTMVKPLHSRLIRGQGFKSWLHQATAFIPEKKGKLYTNMDSINYSSIRLFLIKLTFLLLHIQKKPCAHKRITMKLKKKNSIGWLYNQLCSIGQNVWHLRKMVKNMSIAKIRYHEKWVHS